MDLFNPERHPLFTVALIAGALVLWLAVRAGALAGVLAHVHVGVK